jgi:hypothetical protein
VGLLLLAAGCYESSTPTGPPERGTVDEALLGSWRCEDPSEGSTQVATLEVLRFDRSQYYLEWREEDRTYRYRAYSTQVHQVELFNVQELKSLPGTTPWYFLRAVRRKDGGLELSVVKKDSLKDLVERAAIRAIERRVKDDELYEPWAVCAAKHGAGRPTTR